MASSKLPQRERTLFSSRGSALLQPMIIGVVAAISNNPIKIVWRWLVLEEREVIVSLRIGATLYLVVVRIKCVLLLKSR